MKACWYRRVLVITGLISVGYSSIQAADRPPNVVIIFMDDMGLGDLSSFGAVGYKTKNIDQLASEGLRLTNFHVPQAVCSASRAALMTGCYPNRVGMYGALSSKQTIGLSPAEITIADLLKQKGYKTGMVGKWHLGNRPVFLPTQQGFDEYLGLPYSNDMWPVNFDGMPAQPGQPKYGNHPPLPLLQIRKGQNIPDTALLLRNLADQGSLVGRYTDRAIDFIRENKSSPFFLYMAHSMPHIPLQASPNFAGKSGIGMFGDVMLEIDWSVGQVMQTLKKLNLDRNTIVILSSDNGPWLNFGDHAGNTNGLREGKGTSWEGGTHVPGIIRWPAKIKAGSVSNAFTSTIDILPTLASISGAELPPVKIDGIDISPLITGQAQPSLDSRKYYYYYHQNDLEAVRMGHWKLILPHSFRSYEDVLPGKDGFPGPYKQRKQESFALYDLRRDPGERYDVKTMYPEMVSKLQAIAEEARADLGDNLTNRTGSNRRLPLN